MNSPFLQRNQNNIPDSSQSLAEQMNELMASVPRPTFAEGLARAQSFRDKAAQAKGSMPISATSMQGVVAGLRAAYAADASEGSIDEALQVRNYNPNGSSTGYRPPEGSVPRDANGVVIWGNVPIPEDASPSYKAYVTYMNQHVGLMEKLRVGELTKSQYDVENANIIRSSGFLSESYQMIDMGDHHGLPQWIDTPDGRIATPSPQQINLISYGENSGYDVSQEGIVGEKQAFESYGARKLWNQVKSADQQINRLNAALESGVDMYGRSVNEYLRSAFMEQIGELTAKRSESWLRLVNSNMYGKPEVQRAAPFRGHIPEDVLREMENYDATKNI